MKLLVCLIVLPLFLIAQSDPAFEAYKDWESQHRTGDYKSRGQALFEASTEWVAKWPDSSLAWQERRDSLFHTHNRSADLWKAVDENLIRLSPPHTFASMAAYDWVTYGILLNQAEALLTSEIAWMDAQPRPTTSPEPTLADRINEANFSAQRFGPLCTLATAETKLKEFDAARATISRIKAWLDGDFRRYFDQDQLEAFPDYGSKYFILSAQLAEAEGRKADALAFYRRVITDPSFHREYGGYIQQTRVLWQQLGGTQDGWVTFSEVPPLPTGTPSGYPGVSFLPWLSLDYKIPPTDAARFQGKTTLVYFWTAKCAPYWGMLSAIQLLHGKARDNFQVITLTVEEDKEKLADYMKDKGYDFSVMVNTPLVNKLLPRAVPGQVWIVDSSGAIRLQRTVNNFNVAEQALVDEALYKLSQVSQAIR